jgi:hypothetical protein
MIAYEIHWRYMGKDHLIGVLPERRRKPERITLGSIFAWTRTFLHDKSDSISIIPIFLGGNWKEGSLSNHSSGPCDNVI